MDRRNFLKGTVPAFAALSLGIAGCRDDVTPSAPAAAPPPPPPVGLPAFPPLTFVTCDPSYTDYRPAVDTTGTRFVFERTPFPNPHAVDTVLYLITSGGPSCAMGGALFLAVPANPPPSFPVVQTRPDWSWVTGKVAFSGVAMNTTTIEAHIVASDGKAPSVVPATRAHIYPIWTSDGTQLIIYNNSSSAAPVMPVTSLINLDGSVPPGNGNLNGMDLSTTPTNMFGGFAAPKPGNPTQIAFAGQPALATWGVPPGQTPPAAAVYNQDNNYVFLNASNNGAYSSAPLEPAASITTYNPLYQGRAPYWSPDGNYVVFESSRAGGYALFLANVTKGTPPVQLTDPTYWAQHAKFLPGGTGIVFTALQSPSTPEQGPRGIATIDISAFLG